VQCHGPGGAGIGAAFPALVGQSSAYIAAQLHAFKSGTRPGGPQDLMKVVASKLADGDITAVANYFGGVKP
jgi:cytochrome c553